MWGPGPANFEGTYYQLRDCDALPKPAEGRPPIVLGGGGEKRTLQLAAKYAAEWSAPGLTPEAFRRKLGVLAEHCASVGRDPATVRHSMLSMGPVGATQADIEAATQQQIERTPPSPRMSLAEYRQALKEQGGIVGGVGEVVDSLGQLAAASRIPQFRSVMYLWARPASMPSVSRPPAGIVSPRRYLPVRKPPARGK